MVSSVTAPLRARARPRMFVRVVTVMDAKARMVPRKEVLVPSVAELPICQKTLQAWVPPVSSTRLFDAVVSVEPIWKMNIASGLPCASSVVSPVSKCEDDCL